jgi:hypothetical protein
VGTPIPVGDGQELLFWTLMRRFEAPALARYRSHAPVLATAEKTRFVEVLSAMEPRDDLLATHQLTAPTDTLLSRADGADEASTLIVEGLVLERLRLAIYRIAASIDRASDESRTFAAAGQRASGGVCAVAAERIAASLGTGEALFAVFAPKSHAVIGALDGLAEPVDRTFGERFGLHFAEVMGEFTAELIGACTELGMQRRKVVGHLTSVCMGL